MLALERAVPALVRAVLVLERVVFVLARVVVREPARRCRKRDKMRHPQRPLFSMTIAPE